MRILKIKNNYGIITVLLALVLALSFFIPNMVTYNGRFHLNTDYITQVVPYTVECQRAIKSGEFFWNWNTELGSNLIGSYSPMLGSLSFWAVFLFRTEAVPYVISLIYILKYVLAAYFAYLYLKRFTREPFWAVIAALMYAFSGFSLFNVVFYSFHDALVLFPLVLLAAEKLMVDGKKGLFLLVVFISAVTSFYFFIAQTVFLAVYGCIRIFYKKWTNLKRIGTALFEGAAGVALASFLLVPAYFFLAEFTRATAKIGGLDMLLYYPTRYLDILRGFIFPPEVAGTNKFIISGDANWGSVSIWIPMVGIMGAVAFILKNKRNWLTAAMIISVLMSYIPILNQSFQLFSNVYYTRWWYMPCLLMALATVCFFECSGEELYEKTGKRAAKISIGLYLAVVGGIFAWVGFSYFRGYHVNIDIKGYTTYFVFTLLCYIFAYVLLIKGRRNIKRNMLVSLLVVICIFSNYYILMLGKTYSKYISVSYAETCFDTKPELDFINRTDERVEVTEELTRNQTLYYNLMPLNFYHSLVPQSTIDFYNSLGLSRSVNTFVPAEKYAAIRPLLSVRWYFNSAQNGTGTAPVAGFRYYGRWKGYNVWENRNWIPFGFTYRKYIKYSDYMELPVDKRDRTMLKALVIDNSKENEVSKVLKPFKADNEEFGDEDLAVDSKLLKENACRKFSRDGNGFIAEITLENEDLVFFSVPHIKGWKAYVNGKQTEIFKANIGFMAVKAEKGNSIIRFEYTPYGLLQGVLLSAAALLLVLAYGCLIIIYRRRIIK